ncbi:MAG: triose-phosphate isomerase, partial [Sulfobacillus sp.]
MTRRPLLAANWKMFKTVAQSVAYGRELIRRLETSAGLEAVDVLICPTSLSLWPLAQRLAGTAVRVGAQNLDLGSEGAMTGAVSGYLLREAGAEFVIVGHSERRQ